jgi:DNA-binding SARP family transcriptional activator
VEFRVLGPIELVRDGRGVPPGRKMVCALLATLLVHARVVRTTDQLIDDLWPHRAPPTARPALHNLLSTLRRMVGHDVLETSRDGYLLAVSEEQVDALRFERLLSRSRGEPCSQKVRTLESALSLWRGSPLVDVRYESFAQGEIRRLEELHTHAREELLDAKLALGASDSVVAELRRLVEDFPLRERLRMQLMLALHRCGRSVEALATYAEWRCRLIETWGMEPGLSIRELCDDIRVHAPSLASRLTAR